MQPYEDTERVRVSDAADRIAQGHDGKDDTWVRYDLHGWIVELRGQASSPIDGPEFVRLFLDWAEDEEGKADAVVKAITSGGITTDVMRSVPMSDARKCLRRLRGEVLLVRDQGVYDLPERMVTRDDWIAFARAYGRSAARNPQQPIAHLAAATGLSVNTINARLRRAQELGLLQRQGPPGWLILSDEARREQEQ